jgi:hypothetical protein
MSDLYQSPRGGQKGFSSTNDNNVLASENNRIIFWGDLTDSTLRQIFTSVRVTGTSTAPNINLQTSVGTITQGNLSALIAGENNIVSIPNSPSDAAGGVVPKIRSSLISADIAASRSILETYPLALNTQYSFPWPLPYEYQIDTNLISGANFLEFNVFVGS